MRITEIEIKNFKAFYGTYRIDLRKTGKNLLVYGENGSGKSSLYFALKLFLESGDDPSHRFENDQNIFIEDPGYIKLSLRADPQSRKEIYEWSESVKETDTEILERHQRQRVFSTISHFWRRTTPIAIATPWMYLICWLRHSWQTPSAP